MQRTPSDGEPGHEVLPNPSPCFGPLSGRGTLLMSLMARGSLLAVARSTVLLALIGQAAGFGVWTNGVSSARPTTRIAAACSAAPDQWSRDPAQWKRESDGGSVEGVADVPRFLRGIYIGGLGSGLGAIIISKLTKVTRRRS